LVQNLNLDFNVVRVQAILEIMQRMALDGSPPPLVVLAPSGAEGANLVITEKLAGIPQREPSISDNDQARRARSEVVPSASPNHRLSEHDAQRRITQNRVVWEYVCEQDDLHNVIEDRMCLKLGTPSPPR
jgi:hypothetical protein